MVVAKVLGLGEDQRIEYSGRCPDTLPPSIHQTYVAKRQGEWEKGHNRLGRKLSVLPTAQIQEKTCIYGVLRLRMVHPHESLQVAL